MTKTVLIVDDSRSVRSVVRLSLEAAGYEVIEACDGRDALLKMTGQKIHLIISDVNMPNMDGIAFIKAVKKLEYYKFTPICILTTDAEEWKMAEGKTAGANMWLIKPFQPPKLLKLILKLIG